MPLPALEVTGVDVRGSDHGLASKSALLSEGELAGFSCEYP